MPLQQREEAYYNLVEQYASLYEKVPHSSSLYEPLLFYIRGPYRDEVLKKAAREWDWVRMKILLVFLVTTFLFIMWETCFIITGIVSVFLLGKYYVSRPSLLFNGTIVNINDREIGVLIPSEEEEKMFWRKNFRNDCTMPESASYAKQHIVAMIRNSKGYLTLRVVEIGETQTVLSTIVDDYELENYSSRTLCSMIKEEEITAYNGKSYGSGIVFRG
jgi:hypothetical protein